MEWFLANSGRVFSLAGQHLVLAVLPMIFGLLIADPAGPVRPAEPGPAFRGGDGVLAAVHDPLAGAFHHPAHHPRDADPGPRSTWWWP